VWLASQTIISRFTSLLSQLALAWLLDPKDFGQIGLVYTITAFATQLTNPGVDDVMLQKQNRMERWMTAAFWMSIACALAGALAMSASGALVVWIARHFGNEAYGNVNIIWMIMILAGAAPLTACSLVPATILRSELRFARLASINLGEVVAQQALTVLLAALGFGAYSFVIPVPLVAALKAIALWILVRPPIRAHLSVHRWPALISSTGWVFGFRMLSSATGQGDYMVLGALYANAALVGQYFFAFMLSTQVIRVLCDNANAVLLPALNAINHDLARMEQAVQRATRALAAMVIPVATLQILLAGPAIRLLFAAKWQPAIPLVQLLSLGPILMAPAWPSGSMILAMGRFRSLFLVWIFIALSFFGLVIPATWYYAAAGTATAVSLWSWLVGITIAAFAHRSRRGAVNLTKAVLCPIVAATAGAAAGAVIVGFIPHSRSMDLLALLLVTPLVGFIYVVTLRRLDPEAVRMLTAQFSNILRPLVRLLRRSAPSLPPNAASSS
jgi:PST family polysaccharide transporter